MSERCEVCDRPRATDAQWRDVPPGERDDLCWGREQCEAGAVDWRERATLTRLDLAAAIARAERAEAGLAALRDAGDEVRAALVDHKDPGRRYFASIDALGAVLADTDAAAEAYRASVVEEETAAALRAEIERLSKGRTTTAACLAALRDYPDADFSRHVVPAEESIGYHQAWQRDLAKGRAHEAERDTLAAALAEARSRAVSVASSLAEVEVGGHEGDEESGVHDEDCQACAIEATRAATGALCEALAAPPADLAAERDRRVRAEALDEAADVLGEYDDWHNQDGAAWLRARAADERGGK